MAIWRPCGKPNPNEAEAIEALREAFDDEWTLLTSIPRYSAGREIDALLLGPRGIVVLELKYHSGTIVVPFTGAWTGFNDDKKETPLEQAEVASQILKSTLIREDPDLKKVWVDYVVIMTNPNCHLQVHERLKSQYLVGLLPDAVPLVEGPPRATLGAPRQLRTPRTHLQNNNGRSAARRHCLSMAVTDRSTERRVLREAASFDFSFTRRCFLYPRPSGFNNLQSSRCRDYCRVAPRFGRRLYRNTI